MESLKITISGDIRSGKTTVANVLFNELKRLGVDVEIVDGAIDHKDYHVDLTKFDPNKQKISMVVDNEGHNGATK